MFTPPRRASRPPNQSCQPQPPPLAARTTAMNRKAIPKQNVPSPSTSMPAALRTPGAARAGDDRPGVQRPGASVDRPLDEEGETDREHHDRTGRSALRVGLLQEQEPTEHQEEDADPRQPGTSGAVGPPLPVVDPGRLAGRPPAAIRAEVRDGFGRIIHRAPLGCHAGRSIAGDAARPDGPRSDRPRRRSGSRCPTSTRRSRCGRSRIAGTTGSSPATSRSSSRSSRGSARPAAATSSTSRLPGVGRDPAWLARPGHRRRPPRRDGLRLVSRRLLPGGGADRSAVRRRPGRRAGPRGDRRGGGDRRPAGHHRRDRHRQAVGLARPRSASIAPRPARPDGPAWRSRPTPSCRRSVSTSCRIFEAEGADPTRVVIGHADSYPVTSSTTSRSSSAARASSSTSSA